MGITLCPYFSMAKPLIEFFVTFPLKNWFLHNVKRGIIQESDTACDLRCFPSVRILERVFILVRLARPQKWSLDFRARRRHKGLVLWPSASPSSGTKAEADGADARSAAGRSAPGWSAGASAGSGYFLWELLRPIATIATSENTTRWPLRRDPSTLRDRARRVGDVGRPMHQSKTRSWHRTVGVGRAWERF